MRKESYEFLKTAMETPSPSGFEQPIQRVVRERMKPLHRKPITASDAECRRNPRSRSAKLRCGIQESAQNV